jgi:hypothetical protein
MKPYTYGRRYIEPRDQYRRWVDPRYRTLRQQDVITYLRLRGWTEVSTDRPGFLVFQEPPGQDTDDAPFYQFVPESEKYANYPQAMFELLTGLAEIENRQATEVIEDIVQLGAGDSTNGTGKPRMGNPVSGA